MKIETKLYYTAPSDEMFKELKQASIDLCVEGYPEDSSPFYAKEKTDRIKNIANVADNFMYMVAMFDIHNQRKLSDKLTPETRKAVCDRMIDSGQPDEFNPFLP